MEEERYVKGTYALMKQQAGWKNVSTPTSFLVAGKPGTPPKSVAQIQMDFYVNKMSKLIGELSNTNNRMWLQNEC